VGKKVEPLVWATAAKELGTEAVMGVADVSRSGFVGATAFAGQNTKEIEGSAHESSGGTSIMTLPVYLHSAAERGEVDAVCELLVNKGADAGSLDSVGRSPLFLATQGGHLAVVSVLLEFSAEDPSCIPPDGPNGMDALVKAAARKGHHAVLRALIDHGADADAADSSGSTPLQHAAMMGKTGSIDVLVACGADVDSADLDGCTALHWAAMEGHGEAIVALLRHGADIDAPDKAGRTPLLRACAVDDNHATEAAEFLLLWGADDGVVDSSGRTAEECIEMQRRGSGARGDGSAKQRAHESLLQLLRTTPADRAWCRHGLVILCKARLGQGAIGTVLDRLVTLEEEELFEKAWALEVGDGDDDDNVGGGGGGGEEPRRREKARDARVQQHGEEPMAEKQEERRPREGRNKRPPSNKAKPRNDQAWIKPRHEEEEEEEKREEREPPKIDQRGIKQPHAEEERKEEKERRKADQRWIKQRHEQEVTEEKKEEDQRRERQRPPSQKSRDETRVDPRGGQPPLPSEFAKFYRLGKKLEKGAFSETYEATKRGGGRGLWVVKRAAQRRSPSSENEHGLVKEVRILRLLTHPTTVAVQDVFSDSPDNFCAVLERCTGGLVFDRIARKISFRERDVRQLCRVLVLCVQHCHDLGIVHRDLRPEHMLLSSSENDATVKLAGFDFARSLPRDGSGGSGRRGKRGLLASEPYVTAEYAAPEVLRDDPYGKAVDMWSLGVIFYTLIGGYHPFHDQRQSRLFRRIRDGSFMFHQEMWGSVSDQAKDFIASLLVVDTSKRMTAKRALEHPWMLAQGKDLTRYDLSFNQAQLQVFNATSKLRAAVRSV
ncbi:unnamed protein product, partial [Pylaiella littoralis]